MQKLVFLLILLYGFEHFPQGNIPSQAFFDGAIIAEVAGHGDFIWVATYGRGIHRFSKKDGKWKTFSTQEKNIDNDFFYTIAASNEFVWAGTTDGLFIYDIKRDQWRKRKFALGGELGNWIRALHYDSQSNMLYIGRFKNITRLDVARNRFTDRDLTISNDPKTNTIKSIRIDGDNKVWIGTEAGVHVYNKKMNFENANAWRFINNKQQGFNGDGEAVSIADILFESNNVWFGVDEFITYDRPQFNLGGIYRYNRNNKWDRFDERFGLQGNGIFCLERTGNIIWAGIYTFDKSQKRETGKGIALIDRTTGVARQADLEEFGIRTNLITSLYYDGLNIWIGTDKGLWVVQVTNPLAVWTGMKRTNVR